jgi:tetratricopeptide (TPR) repeat protein
MKSASATINFDDLIEDILAPEDVHDAHASSSVSGGNAMFLLLSLVLAVAHGFNLYLFLASTLWPVIPLLIHLAISLVVAVIAYTQYRRGMEVQHLALLAIVSATTGIFGVIGALLSFLVTLVFRGRSYHFREWYRTMFPTDSQREPENIYDRITEGLDENPSTYSVMPFTEVMRLGSENQKRRALAKMTSRFSPSFAPAFRAALADSNNAIRVQAATAIAKVEREFTHKLERIEMARTRDPHNALLTLALAKFYDDYAFTGILDGEIERLNRARAIEAYKSYLKLDPNSADAWLAVGRLMYRNQQWLEAADWFRAALDRGWKSHNMILWYFECLFRLGQFRDLRRSILELGRGITTEDDLPYNVRHAVGLWMQVA